MSEIKQPGHTIGESRARRLRAAIYVCVAVQVLLWLGLFLYIAQHANPKGDGMEWVACPSQPPCRIDTKVES
jgi:hypothetical protein